MPTRTLPLRPSLAQLKLQASELRKLHRRADPSALSRIAAHHPAKVPLEPPLKLADAQLVIAREYGYENWSAIKHFVETAARLAEFAPHPHFEEAVAAIDAGDVAALRSLLEAYPDLVYARTNLEPPYHYFTGATLLNHIAGNPGRVPMPSNIVEVARLLLDSGADVHAATLGPNGGRTMGLLLTSAQASLANASGPLIDLLLEYGDRIKLGPKSLYGPISNHAPRAAEHMIVLGAKPDLFVAAGLGRMDWITACFDSNGRLVEKLRKDGKPLSQRDAIGLAMLIAYVRGQNEAVDFLLEKKGNWNMIGVNNGTALHRATSGNDLEMVKRLVAKGADMGDRNNPFVATPLSWADHFGHEAIVEWIRENCKIDIHDAVSFGFTEQVEARLRENPASVNERRSQWSLPQSTPLHCAALTQRTDLAKLLLDRGADPNLIAGNGQTALDIARNAGAEKVVELLTPTDV